MNKLAPKGKVALTQPPRAKGAIAPSPPSRAEGAPTSGMSAARAAMKPAPKRPRAEEEEEGGPLKEAPPPAFKEATPPNGASPKEAPPSRTAISRSLPLAVERLESVALNETSGGSVSPLLQRGR